MIMKASIFVCGIALLLASAPVQALEEKDLQTFINEAIKAGGGEVVIPPGEYIITKGLVVRDAKNINIAGLDKERTVLRCAENFEGSIFTITGSAEKLTLQKMTFDGAGTGRARAILTEKKDKASYKQMSIEDGIFKNQLQSGVSLFSSTDVNVQRCSFADVKGTALYLMEVSKAEVSGNWIIRSAVGLNLEGCNEIKVTANEVTQCEKAFVNTSKSGNSRVSVQNNAFHGKRE